MRLFPGAGAVAKYARTEYSHVGEVFQVQKGGVQGLSAAHRKAGNGTMLAVGKYAVMRFRIRHDVVRKVLVELIVLLFATAARARPDSGHGRGRGSMPGRHDHDH